MSRAHPTRRAWPLATVLAAALAGCASMAPPYERPAAPVAAAFPDTPAGAHRQRWRPPTSTGNSSSSTRG